MHIQLQASQLAYLDAARAEPVLEAGQVTLSAGMSASDIKLTGKLAVRATKAPAQHAQSDLRP